MQKEVREMKKILSFALVLALLCVPLPWAAHGEDRNTLLVATDPHFIAPSLTDHGLYFTALTENSDGKLMK